MTANGRLERAPAVETEAPALLSDAARRAFQLPVAAVAVATAMLVVGLVFSLTIGPIDIGWRQVVLELVDRLPVLAADSGLTEQQEVILWQWRMPRAVLGVLVGASLALSGATYQGVFRNPLADPYLLGVAAGAGLGATLVIVGGVDTGWGPFDTIAGAAFVGALAGVGLTATLGGGPGRAPATLLLAGVAVASFLTAAQTYLMQRNTDTLRQVYTWILGRLGTTGWDEVLVLAPYLAVCGVLVLAHRRHLDVLRLGDDEAASLGVDPRRVRVILVIAASLLAAAAVSVSGLISFVGIIVPHLIRLAVGASYRIVLPLAAIGGGAFLMLADLAARTVASPAELPIGVVTAFVGAPFFAIVLLTSRRALA
ncbi:MAG: iron ABC transporter permease, partial [Acidimicrobiia bacterium]|nr:iron ABC transporter permease [Acidimicrobiia bacterium]